MNHLKMLYNRRAICEIAIRTLMTVTDDPRQPDALEHYQAQQREIDAKITELEQAERQRLGLPEPEPVVVGLKPAVLFGKSQ